MVIYLAKDKLNGDNVKLLEQDGIFTIIGVSSYIYFLFVLLNLDQHYEW